MPNYETVKITAVQTLKFVFRTPVGRKGLEQEAETQVRTFIIYRSNVNKNHLSSNRRGFGGSIYDE